MGTITVGALAATDSSETSGLGALDPRSPIMRQALEAGQQEMRDAEAYRQSSAGRAEREDSRTAFADQPDDQALATARAEFPGLVESPPLRWPRLSPGQKIDRYLAPGTAIVEGESGRRAVLESDLPLRGETPNGASAPLDMALSDQGASFEPKSTGQPVELPKHADADVRFTDQHLGVTLAGADPTAAKLSSNKVFFANALTDGDFVVEPTPRGAELSLVLRSPDSPTDPALQFDLPQGAELRLADQPNTAEVVRDGRRLALIAAAAAVDAQEKPVNVTYSVNGDRLVMHVAAGGDVAWPVAVDPTTYVYDNNGQGAASGSTGFTWPGWSAVSNRGPTGCPYPNAQPFYECKGSDGSLSIWGFTAVQPPYIAYDYGAFQKKARAGTYIFAFHAANMSHTSRSSITFAGICDTGCAAWQAGHWWTPLDKATNVPKSGPNAMRTNPTSYMGQTDYFCYDPTAAAPSTSCPLSTTANAPGLALNNTAKWGMLMTGTPPTAQPTTAIGGAATLSADNIPPKIVSITHSNAPSSGWVASYADTVTLRAADNNAEVALPSYTVGSDLNTNGEPMTGVGLGTASISGPMPAGQTAPAAQSASCSTTTNYDNCPQVLTFPGITYSAPEGISTYTPSSSDIVGNSQNGTAWTVKVDKTPPTGSLTSVPTYASTTAVISGTMSDSLSGPQDAKVQFQAPGSTTWQDACARQATTSAFSCNWNPSAGDGIYKVRAELRDGVLTSGGGPNVSYTASTDVIVDRIPPSLTEIAPAVGSQDYADETSDTGLTEASFVQHDTGSGVAQTTLEYNTATDGTSTGAWTPADADPATGDGDASTFWNTSDMDEGLHLVRASTFDKAGNVKLTTYQVLRRRARKPCLTTALPGEQACYAGYGFGTPSYALPRDTSPPPCSPNGYAAPNGIDSPGRGSATSPFRTPDYLANQLTSGQVGCLKPNPDGTAATYAIPDGTIGRITNSVGVTLESEPGKPRATWRGRVVLSGDNITLRELNLDGRNLTEMSDCPWEGQPPCPQFSPGISGSYDKLIDNDITSHADLPNAATDKSTHNNCINVYRYPHDGSSADGPVPKGTVIKDNVIHDCGVPTEYDEKGKPVGNPAPDSPAGGHWHGIYISDAGVESSNAPPPADRDYTTIRNNLIYRNADRGVQLYPDAYYVRIDHNTIYDNGAGINLGKRSSHNSVTHNIIANSRNGTDASYFTFNGSYPYLSTNHTIYNVYTDGGGTGNVVADNCLWLSFDRSRGVGDLTERDEGVTVKDQDARDPEFRDPKAASPDFRVGNSACQAEGANPSGHYEAFGLKDSLTTGSRITSGTSSEYTQAVAARLYGSTHKVLTTGVTDGYPCRSSIKSGKWTAFYRYASAGGVTHTSCIKQMPLGPEQQRDFAAFVTTGSNGKIVDRVRVPGRGTFTIPHGDFFLAKPIVAEVFGVTNAKGRGLAGQFSSIKYAKQKSPSGADWVPPDAAHSFPITSKGAGYRTLGVQSATNPFANFCVFGPQQTGAACP